MVGMLAPEGLLVGMLAPEGLLVGMLAPEGLLVGMLAPVVSGGRVYACDQFPRIATNPT